MNIKRFIELFTNFDEIAKLILCDDKRIKVLLGLFINLHQKHLNIIAIETFVIEFDKSFIRKVSTSENSFV